MNCFFEHSQVGSNKLLGVGVMVSQWPLIDPCAYIVFAMLKVSTNVPHCFGSLQFAHELAEFRASHCHSPALRGPSLATVRDTPKIHVCVCLWFCYHTYSSRCLSIYCEIAARSHEHDPSTRHLAPCFAARGTAREPEVWRVKV